MVFTTYIKITNNKNIHILQHRSVTLTEPESTVVQRRTKDRRPTVYAMMYNLML